MGWEKKKRKKRMREKTKKRREEVDIGGINPGMLYSDKGFWEIIENE